MRDSEIQAALRGVDERRAKDCASLGMAVDALRDDLTQLRAIATPASTIARMMAHRFGVSDLDILTWRQDLLIMRVCDVLHHEYTPPPVTLWQKIRDGRRRRELVEWVKPHLAEIEKAQREAAEAERKENEPAAVTEPPAEATQPVEAAPAAAS